MWFSLSLFVCSLFSSGAEARNAAAFPGASAPFVLGGCKAGPAGGGGHFAGVPAPRRATLTLRATSHPAAPLTLPKLASGPAGTSCPAGIPAPSPAAHVAKIGLAGFPAALTPQESPRPRRAANAAFFFIGLAGFALQVSCRVWLCGYLFNNISTYRCSFMTERTKGPAVSMRRPPTRGPLDPWTPHTVSLRVHLFAPYPRRPTLDGPAHNVRLHSPYAAAPRTLWATSPPAPPLTLPKSA